MNKTFALTTKRAIGEKLTKKSMSGGGGSAAAPPHLPPEDENEVQRNIRLKVCAYCKKPGARLKCEACLQRTYCDKKCQKNDWKTVHREQCEKLQQVFVPPPAGWRERAAGGAGETDAGVEGGGGGAAAAGGEACAGGGEDEDENLCPICLDNEDDAFTDGTGSTICTACGQLYCGACNAGGLHTKSPNCPTCRAPFLVPHEVYFKRCWKLVHDRSPGRYTEYAQVFLGFSYLSGKGVKQDDAEGFKWYKRAADNGFGDAMGTIGLCYRDGRGVAQDFAKAVPYLQCGVEQTPTGSELNTLAMKALSKLQERNAIPTPPPGTRVTVILLASAAAAVKYNNRKGIVVVLPEGQPVVKAGRAAVLLEGEAKPISFKLMNLRIG